MEFIQSMSQQRSFYDLLKLFGVNDQVASWVVMGLCAIGLAVTAYKGVKWSSSGVCAFVSSSYRTFFPPTPPPAAPEPPSAFAQQIIDQLIDQDAEWDSVGKVLSAGTVIVSFDGNSYLKEGDPVYAIVGVESSGYTGNIWHDLDMDEKRHIGLAANDTIKRVLADERDGRRDQFSRRLPTTRVRLYKGRNGA